MQPGLASATTPRSSGCHWRRDLPRVRLDGVGAVARRSGRSHRRPRCSLHVAATAAPIDKRRARSRTIIVTAQKRTENLQNVPISIQVLGDEQARSSWTSRTSTTTPSCCRACRTAHRRRRVLRSGLRAGLHARRGQRRRRQPFRPAAQRRHVPRRAADHHDPGRARHPHLRHRARRGAGRPAGHAVRRELAKPARSASSPTSPTRPASRPATTLEANAIDDGGIGYVVEGFVNIAAVAERGDAPGRLGASTTPATSTTSTARALFPTSGITMDNAALVDDNYNDADTTGGARGAEDRPQRQLVDHADRHRPAAEGERQFRLRSGDRRPEAAPLLPRTLRRPLDAGGADGRRARSATSTSSTPART